MPRTGTDMFGIAPRVASLSPRRLMLAASAVVVLAQFLAAASTGYAVLTATRIATGLGFGLANTALNLAAARAAHPARAISVGIALQTLVYAAINVVLPIAGVRYGVAGMFVALGALSALFALPGLLLPGVTGAPAGAVDDPAPTAPRAGLGGDGARVLAAMALFTYGGTACATLTTTGQPWLFAATLTVFNVAWFTTYPLILGIGYATDPSGRLAVLCTAVWLAMTSLGSLTTGAIAQIVGGYTPVGPIGLALCLAAAAVAWPLARRLDEQPRGLTSDAPLPTEG